MCTLADSTCHVQQLPPLLVEAARNAAVADGVHGTSLTSKSSDVKNVQVTKGMPIPCSESNHMNPLSIAGTKGNFNPSLLENAHSALSIVHKSAIFKDEPQTSTTSTTIPTQKIIPGVSENTPNVSCLKVLSTAPSAGSAAYMASSTASTSPPVPVTSMNLKTSVQQSSSASPASQGVPSANKKKGPPLRRGKWTSEEEAYANRLIQEFKAGLLPLTDGTTLRTFLSKLLNCDPMRISKKFVGNNCIGKQVFRRRTADINRLTPDQIQQSRAELSELERRFLDRVAQNNRVKSSGVTGNTSTSPNGSTMSGNCVVESEETSNLDSSPPSPPWLKTPNGFKHGTGASTAAAALSSGTNNRAAAVGRKLLSVSSPRTKGLVDSKLSHKSSLPSCGSAGILALADLQRRQSQQNFLSELSQSMSKGSGNNLLAAAAAFSSASNNNKTGTKNGNLSGTALVQLARNASAARLAGLAAAGNSMSNMMLRTGLSRDQLSQIAREHQRNSSSSLSNMVERQSSLDALMSLDFQSLQSIDNLANLIQTGNTSVSKSEMKNWSGDTNATGSLDSGLSPSFLASSNTLSNAMNVRRLASEGRMESLIRSLSGGNVANTMKNNRGSNATFNNLLQSMQNNLNGSGGSSNNLFGPGSALNLANMLRADSSTGLTALRMQDGLAQRNSSVDDFLSLVASGDIPHQDPHMLNVPLQSVMQQQQGNQSGAHVAATYLAQQQLLAQAKAQASNASHGSSITHQIASLGGFANNSSAASLLGQIAASQGSLRNNAAAAALQQQMNLNASALAMVNSQKNPTNNSLKRKFLSNENSSNICEHPAKR